MFEERLLASIRREISRSVGSIDDAWEIVLELVATDWNEVAQADKETRRSNCSGCYKPVLHKLMTHLSSDIHYCAACEYAIQKGYKCICPDCKKKFISHGYDQYKAPSANRGIREISRSCSECTEKRRRSFLKTMKCSICGIEQEVSRELNSLICQTCQSKSRRGLDDKTVRREYQKVHAHIQRAQALNLPATLTLDQWLVRLVEIDWTCLYCLEQPYNSVDHFIPLCKKGGTTLDNVVPSCDRCNKLKGQRHPDVITSIPRDALDRVQKYLQSHL